MQDLGLNESGSDASVTQLRRTIREAYIDVIAGVTVDSVDSLDQTNSVITSVLVNPSELTLNSQVNTSNSLKGQLYVSFNCAIKLAIL